MEPDTNNTAVQGSAPQQHGMGALVGTLIVLAVLVLGGVYFFLNKQQMIEPQSPPVILGDTTPIPAIEESRAPSPSDTVADISADIDATNLKELDAQIDADLKAIEVNL